MPSGPFSVEDIARATTGRLAIVTRERAFEFQFRVDCRPEISEPLVGLCAGGGKAVNVAAFARTLGLGARLFARLGDGDLAERALAPLRTI